MPNTPLTYAEIKEVLLYESTESEDSSYEDDECSELDFNDD